MALPLGPRPATLINQPRVPRRHHPRLTTHCRLFLEETKGLRHITLTRRIESPHWPLRFSARGSCTGCRLAASGWRCPNSRLCCAAPWLALCNRAWRFSLAQQMVAPPRRLGACVPLQHSSSRRHYFPAFHLSNMPRRPAVEGKPQTRVPGDHARHPSSRSVVSQCKLHLAGLLVSLAPRLQRHTHYRRRPAASCIVGAGERVRSPD